MSLVAVVGSSPHEHGLGGELSRHVMPLHRPCVSGGPHLAVNVGIVGVGGIWN